MGFRIRSTSSHVNDAALARFVADPAGPIRRDLRRRARNVERVMVRVTPRRTGLLVSTIRLQEGLISAWNPYVDVVVGRQGVTNYLGYIIHGTRPHEIRARNRKYLRFVVNGHIVFARKVWHPGTRPNNFLLIALPAARF